MGTGILPDGVKVRDSVSPDNYLTVNPDGSINVTPAAGSTFVVKPKTTSTATGSVVSVDTNETTLLAANANRLGGTIQNHDATVLAVYFTTGQSFAQAPFKLAQYQSIDLGQPGCIYTGVVYGKRASTTGDAGVVEES